MGNQKNSFFLGVMMAVITGLTWSVLAIGLKYALTISDSLTIIWIRFAVALLGLGGISLFFQRENLVVFKKWPKMGLLAGLCLGLNYLGYMKGVEFTGASNAQIFIQAAPLGLALLGVFVFKERLSHWQKLGFLLAIIGFSFFYYDQLSMTLQNSKQYQVGTLWVLFGAITWIGYALCQKVEKNWSAQQINLLIYFTACLMFLPQTDFSQLLQWSPSTWGLMIILGLNTIVAYGALGIALKTIPASLVSIIIACNPLLTLLFMHLLSNAKVTWITPEPVTSTGYIGAFIVIFGVVLTVTRVKKT